MSKKKRSGIRFNESLYINFIYDPDTDTVAIYKNGVLITSGGGVTPEELAEILEAYVSKQELAQILLDYATKSELSDYATKSELSDYATKSELSDYATKSELSDYATKSELSDYATKSELSACVTDAELNTILTDYITNGELYTILEPYVDNTELSNILSDYITGSELNTALSDYPNRSEVASMIPTVETGNTSIGSVPSTNYVDKVVVFTKTFPSAPEVVACINSSSNASGIGNMTVSVMGVNKTQFTMRIYNNDSSARTPYVRWIAIR